MGRRRKTPAERREQRITKGVVSLFSGAGLTIFLYYLSGALVLKLPPDVIAKIPFDLDPVVHVIWLLGCIPMLSGVGNIISGLLIRQTPALSEPETRAPQLDSREQPPIMRHSVTDRTTELLDPDANGSVNSGDRVQPLN